MKKLHLINADLLGWWLAERQLPCGGLNGRPEKLQDVCYSWWVIASLKIIGKLDWIDKDKLKEYILQCQDEETGGFSDRPGNMVKLITKKFLKILSCNSLLIGRSVPYSFWSCRSIFNEYLFRKFESS